MYNVQLASKHIQAIPSTFNQQDIQTFQSRSVVPKKAILEEVKQQALWHGFDNICVLSQLFWELKGPIANKQSRLHLVR